jgi:Ca2+-transporting ATPase
MTFLGLVGMMDPPRPEAGAAVRTCAEAGIRVRMITGDHPMTALAVARELGSWGRGGW